MSRGCPDKRYSMEMVSSMNITIVGAGNVGTQFAVRCAYKGHRVIVFTSKPEQINKRLSIVDELGKEILTGEIVIATKDEKTAFEDADVIFVTVPAFCMDDIPHKVIKFIKAGVKIGLIPGNGGGECAFKQCIDLGAVVFGLQRVPSVARLIEYGKTVRATGDKKELFVAALPKVYAGECAELIEGIFDIPCHVIPDYLNLTLTPSNPILHTVRLRNLFKDYTTGITYKRVPLFYEEWNDETSELLLKCDDELQDICHSLTDFDLRFVTSLRTHYESFTVKDMTLKISGIKGFKGLKSPVVLIEGGYIPDFESRYFRADFSYGLALFCQVAEFAGVETPNMKETLEWYYNIIDDVRSFQYSDYGIKTLNDMIEFYSL